MKWLPLLIMSNLALRGLEPEYIIEITESGFKQRENFNIKPKYRYQRYLDIQRDAETYESN